MGILKRIQIGWAAKTGLEKFKMIVDLIACAGTGILAADIADTLASGKKLPSKVAIHIGTMGLGIAAGTASADALDKTIDAYVELYRLHKQEKEMKEAEANA